MITCLSRVRWSIAALVLSSVACTFGGFPSNGCDDDSDCFSAQGEVCLAEGVCGQPPDAGPPDAGIPCNGAVPVEDCDFGTGRHDEVSDVELPSNKKQELAVRFAPSVVMGHPTLFPVSVDYALVEGGPLMQAPYTTQTAHYLDDVDELNAVPVTPQPNLMSDDWTDLPAVDGTGNKLAYWIDVPGDNTGPDIVDETWTAAWDARPDIFNPTVYAHFFWLSQGDGLLEIAYYYYFPWDKFTNSHEADWTNVNVVVKLDGGDYAIQWVHFGQHGFQDGWLADEVYRVEDVLPGGDGDHVVAFTGGEGCQTFLSGDWCGNQSGGSYPYPGLYDFGIDETVAGGTTLAGVAYHANDFDVIVLPDAGSTLPPNLSWYAIPTFMAGQPTVMDNDDVIVIPSDRHRAPVQPAGLPDFNKGIDILDDYSDEVTPEPFANPENWTFINDPL